MKKTALFFACCFLLPDGVVAGNAHAREISGKLYIVADMGGTEDLATTGVLALAENSPDVVQYFRTKSKYSEEQKDKYAAALEASQRNLTDTLSGGPPDPKALDAAKKNYREAFDMLKPWTGPAYYFQEIPGHLATAKADTGAEGEFRFTVPPGKYVIAVAASRVGNKGVYYWLVRVDATIKDQSVILSNENLFETNCAACFQPGRMPGN